MQETLATKQIDSKFWKESIVLLQKTENNLVSCNIVEMIFLPYNPSYNIALSTMNNHPSKISEETEIPQPLQQQTPQEKQIIRIGLLGQTGTGKSSIMLRYVKDQF